MPTNIFALSGPGRLEVRTPEDRTFGEYHAAIRLQLCLLRKCDELRLEIMRVASRQ
jgi:hypothetical protein